MYQFPKDLYTDIRIETVAKTNITLENYEVRQNKSSTDTGAMIRIFDGNRWYYSATTNIDHLQEEIDQLAKMATPDSEVYNHPVIKKLEVNQGVMLTYQDTDVSKIDPKEKYEVLQTYIPVMKNNSEIKISRLYYLDNHTVKHIISSKGTDVLFDIQSCCIAARYIFQIDGNPCRGSENIYHMKFEDIIGKQEQLRLSIEKDYNYYKDAIPVTPGSYTCVLSPEVTGVFAHESFGHKSESDFMVGDETMKREWAIGKRVGKQLLNIIDTGLVKGSGYVPFDDEGCRAKKNYIIKDGILTGRLHSAATAANLEEEPTANARAMNFEFEPIVRMTTTYIDAGNQSKEELIGQISEGVYIESLFHGSGMTTFTIAPQRAYMIRDGKLAEPVRISVITGNVMKTLDEIDGVSNEVELFSFALGGCGKMEQHPLPVGFGGPYIRVNGINVQ
ncbi:MAG: putative Zn-dependent protease-like protein [Herbinix sp.]|jgi:TldD protein|nr:putative Zn-dependent protease-like protein [Herbinix sp.]